MFTIKIKIPFQKLMKSWIYQKVSNYQQNFINFYNNSTSSHIFSTFSPYFSACFGEKTFLGVPNTIPKPLKVICGLFVEISMLNIMWESFKCGTLTPTRNPNSKP